MVSKTLLVRDTPLFRRCTAAFAVLLNVFLLALTVSYAVAAWQAVETLFGADKRLQITVSGEGRVSAKPDVAKITAGVISEDESLAAAQASDARSSQAVVAFLKREGVAESDIKTVGYSIQPRYSSPPPCVAYPCPAAERTPKIVGYQVRDRYEVTVRDLAKASRILAGLVNAGANEVSGIAFTIDAPEELQARARQEAIADARAKAGKLAGDLGRRLGRIVNFSEGGYVPPPIFFERGVALGKGGEGPAPSPSIQPGENEIVVTVSMTYEFK